MPPRSSQRSDRVARFITSMSLSYDQWHDGEGYDLSLLGGLSAVEAADVLEVLTERLADSSGGWRDVEAVATLGTAESSALLTRLLRHPSAEVRLRAAQCVAHTGDAAPAEREIVRLLRDPLAEIGTAALMQMVEAHPTPQVRTALRYCAVDGAAPFRVHAAALLLYLGGGAEESFDWNHRPLFLKFGEDDRAVRLAALTRLEEMLPE
jgi:HEAT repeat protein